MTARGRTEKAIVGKDSKRRIFRKWADSDEEEVEKSGLIKQTRSLGGEIRVAVER